MTPDSIQIAIDNHYKKLRREYKQDCQEASDRNRCWNCGGLFTCDCDLDTAMAVMHGNRKPDSVVRKA